MNKKKLLKVPKIIELNRIDRHTYSDFEVQLAVELYLLVGCGFEKVSGLLKYLNDVLGLGLERIPCANSVENWVKKMGYSIYHQTPKEFALFSAMQHPKKFSEQSGITRSVARPFLAR